MAEFLADADYTIEVTDLAERLNYGQQQVDETVANLTLTQAKCEGQ